MLSTGQELVTMGSVVSKEVVTSTVHELYGCVGCKLIPPPPVYSCGITSHCYCHGCATKFRFICVKLTDDTRHVCGGQVDVNLPKFLRNILEITEFPCNYSAYGCKRILDMDGLESHEYTCQFKTFGCPYGPKCLWKGTILKENFINHLTEYHGVKLLARDSLTLDVIIRRPVLPRDSNVCVWTEVVLETEDVHFLLSFRYEKNLLCVWLWSFEGIFNKSFLTKICMIGPNVALPDELRTIAWWGKPQPYETSVQEIVQTGKCMGIENPECFKFEDPIKQLLPWWRLRVEIRSQTTTIDHTGTTLQTNEQSSIQDMTAAVKQCFSEEQSIVDTSVEINNNDGTVGVDEVKEFDGKLSPEMNKADVKVLLPAGESNEKIKENNKDVFRHRKGRKISEGLGEDINCEEHTGNFYQKVKQEIMKKVEKSKNKKSQIKKANKKRDK